MIYNSSWSCWVIDLKIKILNIKMMEIIKICIKVNLTFVYEKQIICFKYFVIYNNDYNYN